LSPTTVKNSNNEKKNNFTKNISKPGKISYPTILPRHIRNDPFADLPAI